MEGLAVAGALVPNRVVGAAQVPKRLARSPRKSLRNNPRSQQRLSPVRLGHTTTLKALLVPALLLAHLAVPAQFLEPLGGDPAGDGLGVRKAGFPIAAPAATALGPSALPPGREPNSLFKHHLRVPISTFMVFH